MRAPWANRVSGLNSKGKNEKTKMRTKTTGPFCLKCSAWYGELGQEPTVGLYVAHIVEVFREVWRVLRKDGTLWLNLGDSYAGSGLGWCKKPNMQMRARAWAGRDGRPPAYIGRRNHEGLKPKDLMGIPWRVAFALQEDGWWLRRDIIWDKISCMPESVTDRPSGTHEYIFLLSKSRRYYYDADSIREPLAEKTLTTYNSERRELPKHTELGQDQFKEIKAAGWAKSVKKRAPRVDAAGNAVGGNKRSVWRVGTPNSGLPHFAMYPPKLIEPCILAGTSARGCCPECGAPWRRVVERGEGTYAERKERGVGGPYNDNPELRREAVGTLIPAASTTVGWAPTCKHGHADTVPCVVLDPFNGAGTTGEVTIKNNRSYLGIELNPKDVETSTRRVMEQFPLLVWRDLLDVVQEVSVG